METFTSHLEIIGGAFVIVLGWVVWFIKKKLDKVDQIEHNYLKRFEDIKTDNALKFHELRLDNQDKHTEILKAIAEMSVAIATVAGDVKSLDRIFTMAQEEKKQSQ